MRRPVLQCKIFVWSKTHLLEDPGVDLLAVLDNTLGEPAVNTVSKVMLDLSTSKHLQSNLLLGALNRVGAVADVTANGKGKITTDGTW